MEIMRSFDEISDENMVLFYREEFEMVDRGSRMKDLIPKQVRFRLLQRGLIEHAYGLDRNCGFVLSPKGREILDNYSSVRPQMEKPHEASPRGE